MCMCVCGWGGGGGGGLIKGMCLNVFMCEESLL